MTLLRRAAERFAEETGTALTVVENAPGSVGGSRRDVEETAGRSLILVGRNPNRWLCSKEVEHPRGALICMRLLNHRGPCEMMSRSAGELDGVCRICRAPSGQSHYRDCLGCMPNFMSRRWLRKARFFVATSGFRRQRRRHGYRAWPRRRRKERT